MDAVDAVKACTQCGETRGFAEFSRCARAREGLKAECKVCAAARFAVHLAEQRKLPNHRQATFVHTVRNTYGLTVEAVAHMWNDQNGRCALCPKPLRAGKGGAAIDHDHACCPGGGSCGACVRGWLCCPCNTGLGIFETWQQRDDVTAYRARRYA